MATKKKAAAKPKKKATAKKQRRAAKQPPKTRVTGEPTHSAIRELCEWSERYRHSPIGAFAEVFDKVKEAFDKGQIFVDSEGKVTVETIVASIVPSPPKKGA